MADVNSYGEALLADVSEALQLDYAELVGAVREMELRLAPTFDDLAWIVHDLCRKHFYEQGATVATVTSSLDLVCKATSTLGVFRWDVINWLTHSRGPRSTSPATQR